MVWTSFDGKRKLSYSTLVQLATTSEVGHLSIVWRKPKEILHVEARQPVIHCVPFENTSGLYVIPMGLHLSEKEMKRFFDDKIGLGYGYLDALRGYLGIVAKDDNKWQCAELVVAFYAAFGIHLDVKLTPTRVVHEIMTISAKPLLKLQ